MLDSARILDLGVAMSRPNLLPSTSFLAFLFLACTQPPPPAQRAELKQVSTASIEILPTEGQLPYCLAFTTSEKGIVRQLTNDPDNLSVPCPAGRPVGAHRYRIPVIEGKVAVHVFFMDKRTHAGPIAEELFEMPMARRMKLTAMDLRLPGRATYQRLDFAPELESAERIGTEVNGKKPPEPAPAPDASLAPPEPPPAAGTPK